MEDWIAREVISMYMMQALVAGRVGEDIFPNAAAAQAMELTEALMLANKKASELDTRRQKSE